MKTLVALFTILTLAPTAQATRTSASYSMTTEIADNGGRRGTSANYTNNGSASSIAGSSAAPSGTAKSGYVAQLYEIVGFIVTAATLSVNEGASLQLDARQLLDDATYLAVNPSLVTWGMPVAPIASITPGGLATAQIVYQDTPASVQGTFQSSIGSFNFTVLNVANDDFNSYAGDGIDDSWQVQYFGQPPNPLAGPNADADGTGQTNLFKFVAGLNPIDGSRFTLSIQSVVGQTSQKNVIFSPLVAGRTYVVQSNSNLVFPSWSVLPHSTSIDTGATRTVTDLDAFPAPKLYRVQISKP